MVLTLLIQYVDLYPRFCKSQTFVEALLEIGPLFTLWQGAQSLEHFASEEHLP